MTLIQCKIFTRHKSQLPGTGISSVIALLLPMNVKMIWRSRRHHFSPVRNNLPFYGNAVVLFLLYLLVVECQQPRQYDLFATHTGSSNTEHESTEKQSSTTATTNQKDNKVITNGDEYYVGIASHDV